MREHRFNLPDALVRWFMRLGFPVRQAVKRRLGLAHGGAFLAMRTAHDLLVVRHSYRPGFDFPGGGLRSAREDPRDAAARETVEELGVSVVATDLRYLGIVRRGFRGAHDRDHLFEWRCDALPAVRVDNREVVWAGPLSETNASRTDLEITVRWYLRRHARDLDLRYC